MPLPEKLPDSLYQMITSSGGIVETLAERRALFAMVYKKVDDQTWRLLESKKSDFSIRPQIWAMLEDAGYDVENAEYKQDRILRPVVIVFKVSKYDDAKKRVVLEDFSIQWSSGYPEVDDAVLYGFRQAVFSNSSEKSVTGRFTYRFD